MSHNNDEYETLSALIDGELTDDQVRFMLRRMEGHAGLLASWSRYHLISDGVRGQLPPLADKDFVARVMQHIDSPTTINAPHSRPRRHRHRWLRWSAGGAIAAGVAVAALVVTQPQMHENPPTAGVADSQAASGLDTASPSAIRAPTAQAQSMSAPAVPRWLQASPSAAQMARPAAANFSSLGQWMRMNEQQDYYERRLAPYMQLPHARTLHRASPPQAGYHLWSPPAQQQDAARMPLRRQVQ